MRIDNIGELIQKQAEVGRIVTVPPAPAGREDPRRSTQHIHTQPRVIGDRRQSGGQGKCPGLDKSIVGEGQPVLHWFWNLERGCRDDGAGIQARYERFKDLPQLGQFSGVMGCQDEPGPDGYPAFVHNREGIGGRKCVHGACPRDR